MPSPKDLVPIKGSERQPLPGARAVGPADANEHMEVTVVIRPPGSLQDLASEDTLQSSLRSRQQASVDRATAFAADPDDINKVEDFANEYGLHVVKIDAPSHKIVLSGSVADMSAAFG